MTENELKSSTHNVNTECMPGYTGIDCTFECPYPSLGNDCQGYCSCSIELCDVARGCRNLKLESTFTSKDLRSLTAGTVISFKLHV